MLLLFLLAYHTETTTTATLWWHYNHRESRKMGQGQIEYWIHHSQPNFIGTHSEAVLKGYLMHACCYMTVQFRVKRGYNQVQSKSAVVVVVVVHGGGWSIQTSSSCSPLKRFRSKLSTNAILSKRLLIPQWSSAQLLVNLLQLWFLLWRSATKMIITQTYPARS